MEHSEHFSSLFREAGDLLETKTELIKLKTIDKASDFASTLVSQIAVLLLLIFFVLLLSVGAAIYIGEQFDKTYLGFLIVGGFYGIVGFIFYLGSKKLLKGPVSTMLIKKFLNDPGHAKPLD